MRAVNSAHVAERLLDDERVVAAGASGPQDVFLAQRPSALRTLLLYWPAAERVAVVAGRTITILRPDLALSRCEAQESRYDLAADYELRRRTTRRRADLYINGTRCLVFRGSEVERVAIRLSSSAPFG